MINVVQRRDTGRPEFVYGKRCKWTEIEHEIRVTDLALHFKGCPFDRDVKVGQTVPDARMFRDGRTCYIEVDNRGKMTIKKQMKNKWEKYKGVEGEILVVAVTERRMWKLLLGAELVKDQAMFTTFDRLKEDKPWVDWYGKTSKI